MATIHGGRQHHIYPKSEGQRFNTDCVLETVTCPACGVLYAIPATFKEAAKEHPGGHYEGGWSLCCPFGHDWHYTGPTEEERLKKRLAAERDYAARLAAQRDQAEQDARAQKARATRFKNDRDRERTRVRHGVCPCCNRTFEDLARHMESKHPGFPAAEVDEGSRVPVEPIDERVLDALRSSNRALRKREVVAALGEDTRSVTYSLDRLRTFGKVVMVGERGGAMYRLPFEDER